MSWALALITLVACDQGVSLKHNPNLGLVEEAGDAGCPGGMARVDRFCVDRFEASLVEVDADQSERPWNPYMNPGAARVRAVSLRGAVPQGYISGNEALAACRASGKRLCLDREWLRACRGESTNLYPYGPYRIDGACNDSRAKHPADELFSQNPYQKLNSPCLNQLPNSLARTGAFQACGTREGVFDMMGNLHEWTSGHTRRGGIFRGGFYVDTKMNGEGCNYATTAHATAYSDYSTGFRCCADASLEN